MARHPRIVPAAPDTSIADRLSDEIKLAHAIVVGELERMHIEQMEEIAADLCVEDPTISPESVSAPAIGEPVGGLCLVPDLETDERAAREAVALRALFGPDCERENEGASSSEPSGGPG